MRLYIIDSMEGVNNLNAIKLYEAVKSFMGTAESSATKLSKGRSKRRKKRIKEEQPNQLEPLLLNLAS